MRKAFSETLYKLVSENSRLVFLTGDLGFQVFSDVERDYPERFVNVGVAEAELISVAAGLALEGWRPIAYSITSFATARPYEQIRFLVGYQHLPVMIVGAGRGFTYSKSGVSHHASDDIALMSTIPGMTVVIPGDENEVRALMPQLLTINGPSYLTIGRYGEPTFSAQEPPILGKARLLKNGTNVAIISTGEIANEVMSAVDLLSKEGLNPIVYQFHTVKPLDKDTLEKISHQAHTFIVVDEHLPNGSLWSYVADWKAATDNPVSLRRLGPPDQYALGNLSREEVRRRWHYDADAIADMCRHMWTK